MRKFLNISTAVAALALTGIGVAAPANAAGRSFPVAAYTKVYAGPSSSQRLVDTIPVGGAVVIACQTSGQTVNGPLGTSSIWDRIGGGRYVSDTFVKTGTDGYVTGRC